MKVAKLTKLKSALKKLPSFAKLNRSISGSGTRTNDESSTGESVTDGGKIHPVYVGKSLRRYLVSSDVIDHPLFQVLADKSSSSVDGGALIVACEVVLFDHLLWMLENSGSDAVSAEELVEFYSY